MYFEFEARTQRGATWTPMVDVCERDTEIVIFVEMPGVDKSDVQLSWNQGVLIISGQKRQHVPGSGRSRYLCLERAYGQFRREIEINVPIDRKSDFVTACKSQQRAYRYEHGTGQNRESS
jgi:HSP20 family protein